MEHVQPTLFLGLLTVLAIVRLYRWLTRISIANVPGPEPESFLLGKEFNDGPFELGQKSSCLGCHREFFQCPAGEVCLIDLICCNNFTEIHLKCLDRFCMASSLWGYRSDKRSLGGQFL